MDPPPETPFSTSRFPLLFLSMAVLAIGVFFFQIIQPYALPLVLACVLTVLCWPLYEWMTRVIRGHHRIAAAITTSLVVLVVLIPLGIGFILATVQVIEIASDISDGDLLTELENLSNPDNGQPMDRRLQELRSRFTSREVSRMREALANAGSSFGQSVMRRTLDLVANTFTFVVGLIILVLSFYYFLADNEQILAEIRRLSPLEDVDDRELADNFTQVCRGVLVGNVLAAALQAILNMIAFAMVGIYSFWLLGLVTFFLSMIPFLGAASVWASVCVWLLFQERYLAATLLAVYGMLVVSSVDNLIRAYALRDTARIHPLIALISILGAMQLLGVWGIIVGPVAAALFFALVNILHKKTSTIKGNTTRTNIEHS